MGASAGDIIPPPLLKNAASRNGALPTRNWRLLPMRISVRIAPDVLGHDLHGMIRAAGVEGMSGGANMPLRYRFARDLKRQLRLDRESPRSRCVSEAVLPRRRPPGFNSLRQKPLWRRLGGLGAIAEAI